MDQTQARALLAGERARLQRLLQAATGKPQPAELGDEVDDADRRNAEQTGMAVDQLLQHGGRHWSGPRPAAAGSYGRSVRSGQPIPDERLEADPTGRADRPGGSRSRARGARGGRRRGRVGVASHPFEILAEPDITPEEAQASEEDDDEPAPEPSLGFHRDPQPGR